jgi:hypothetical protein
MADIALGLDLTDPLALRRARLASSLSVSGRGFC